MTRVEVEKILSDLKARRLSLQEEQRDLDYRINRLIENKDQLEADVLNTFGTIDIFELEKQLENIKQDLHLIAEIDNKF